ncbi:MAG: DUF1349 domain-containing protein [Blastochloris sp.]|nr:DUF1349 domain-containing protein [Blastochloris sp.]
MNSEAPGFNNVTLYSGSTQVFPTSVWTALDIGNVGSTAGTSSYNTGTGVFTIQSAGVGYESGFHYLHQTMTGDGAWVVRVNSVTGASTARMGLMMRTGLGVNDPFASITMSGTKVFSITRATSGGVTSTSGVNAVLPRWLRVVKTGNSYAMAHSSDGVTWTSRGVVTLPASGTVYVGLAGCSGSTTSTATGSLDQLDGP